MKRSKQLWLATAAGLALGSLTAPAADYYTAQQEQSASDTNPGTRAQPWKTIGRSLSTLKAGDTLYVRAGEYREMVLLASNGWTFAGVSAPPFPGGRSIAAPVRFLAYPGERPVIKGSDVVTGWKPHTGAVWVRENWTYNSQQVFCDGESLQQIGGVMVADLQEYWEGRAGQTPVRLFSSTWRNLNEWLPVKEVEWTLADESATVVIVGITGRMLE